MKKWLLPFIALCIGLGLATVHAQTYPSKPIRIIVPSAPGGIADLLARRIGAELSQSWGQPVVVESRTGGNTQIAAEYVARSEPDGHTLLLTPDVTVVTNPSLYSKLSYDAEKDFAPITGLVVLHHALVVNPSVPANSVQEFIALAKAKAGAINYGTFGAGSAAHLNTELFQRMTGVKLNGVHYRGSALAITDVIAGHIQMMFISVGLALKHAEANKLKILGIGSAKRIPQLPDLPTVTESGVPGFEAKSWFGLFAPSGTPRAAVNKVNAEVRRVLDDPEIQKTFLAPSLLQPITSTPEKYAEQIRTEARQWHEVIRDGKLRIN